MAFFVIGLPMKGDSVEEFDSDVQKKLEMEFEMFGDLLQVQKTGKKL